MHDYKRNCEIKPDMIFPEGMHRIALGVEYNGAQFNGFQKQAGTDNTVQAHLERALSAIANEEITLVCCGRTDAGVHASEQVIHFDTLATRPEKAWREGVNTQLPDEVRIHWSKEVGHDFHARFSAQSRMYRYVLYRSATRSAILGKTVTWTNLDLDVESMSSAAQLLVGEHDFTSFRAAQCQAHSPIRRIQHIRFIERGPLVVMEIKANAFLHHMVRNIMGALLDVGRGKRDAAWLQSVLDSKDRSKSSPTARPWGLYLVKAEFDDEFGLPVLPIGPALLVE